MCHKLGNLEGFKSLAKQNYEKENNGGDVGSILGTVGGIVGLGF